MLLNRRLKINYQKFCVWDLISGDEKCLLETKLNGNCHCEVHVDKS